LATLTPTFDWSAVSGATGSGLYIRDLTTNTLIYPNASGTTTSPLPGTTFTLPAGYLTNNGHAYRWAMTSFNGSAESTEGTLFYFQMPSTAADFTTSVNATTRTITQGQSTTYTLTVQSTESFNAAVSVAALNLPPGYTNATFSPNPVTPPANGSVTSTLTFTTTSSTPAGSYTTTLRATSGSLSHDLVVTTIVQGAAPPAAPTPVAPGSSASPGPTLATLTPTFDWSAVSGATGSGLYIRDLTTNTLIYPNASGTTTSPLPGTTFTLPAGYLTNNGHAYRWGMTSFNGPAESAQGPLFYFQMPSAAADFTTSVNATTRTITQGQSTTYTLTVQSTESFNAAVSVAALNLPTGYSNATFSPNPVTPAANGSATSTLTFTTTSSTPAGSYTTTLRATSGSLTHDLLVTTIVQGAAPPTAPTLVSPGSPSGPGPLLSTSTPVMTWNAVSGATGYGVYILDVTTNVLVFNNDVVGNITGFTLPSGILTSGHSYRWNARASNASGFGGFSTLLYFRR
jgi:O6-methylguanine-DNA--protein-cysteine methyltransferase